MKLLDLFSQLFTVTQRSHKETAVDFRSQKAAQGERMEDGHARPHPFLAKSTVLSGRGEALFAAHCGVRSAHAKKDGAEPRGGRTAQGVRPRLAAKRLAILGESRMDFLVLFKGT
jgi:hypothetical protein